MADYTLEELAALERSERRIGCAGCMYKAVCASRAPTSRAPCLGYRSAIGAVMGRHPWHVSPAQRRGW